MMSPQLMLPLCCTTLTQRRLTKGTYMALPPSHSSSPNPSPSFPSGCSLDGNGILLMAVDNLPAQLPREATDFFGSKLLPFIPDCVSLGREEGRGRERRGHCVKEVFGIVLLLPYMYCIFDPPPFSLLPSPISLPLLPSPISLPLLHPL